jgi:hypothetical protein
VIDLSARFSHRPKPSQPKVDDTTRGTSLLIDAKFDRTLVGNGQTFTTVALHAEDDGASMQRVAMTGQAGPNGAFSATIEPSSGSRQVVVRAADAGALLSGLDVIGSMEGGTLSINGTFDDRRPEQPLAGTAEIVNFRLRNAPALGKLLQAVTLYGLLDALSGPGLNFTRLLAPFRLVGDTLELNDARAFSPSLGLTAKGRVDLARNALDVQGTVVPAYMLNSALGAIPLVGKLFSAEKGGGLLAMNFALRGPLADPTVSVNPLSALAPGVLRDLFN